MSSKPVLYEFPAPVPFFLGGFDVFSEASCRNTPSRSSSVVPVDPENAVGRGGTPDPVCARLVVERIPASGASGLPKTSDLRELPVPPPVAVDVFLPVKLSRLPDVKLLSSSIKLPPVVPPPRVVCALGAGPPLTGDAPRTPVDVGILVEPNEGPSEPKSAKLDCCFGTGMSIGSMPSIESSGKGENDALWLLESRGISSDGASAKTSIAGEAARTGLVEKSLGGTAFPEAALGRALPKELPLARSLP
mmetsp:Transcript_9127/g.24047  ORF Transcript_9127/g.24047 Transcript_9127/m.24047 type:complete len:248 (-) Transcript_9127:1191-1934(-)